VLNQSVMNVIPAKAGIHKFFSFHIFMEDLSLREDMLIRLPLYSIFQ